MALIKCKECGHTISDKALKCPKCGNPNIKEEITVVETPPIVDEEITAAENNPAAEQTLITDVPPVVEESSIAEEPPVADEEIAAVENNPVKDDVSIKQHSTSKKNKLIIITSLIVIGIVISGTIFYYTINKPTDTSIEEVQSFTPIDNNSVSNINENAAPTTNNKISVATSNEISRPIIVTDKGIGEVQLGMNIAKFIPSISLEGEGISQYNFYSRIETKNISDTDFELGYYLYKDDDLVMILVITSDDIQNAKINEIRIYSNHYYIKDFENIKTGITLKKLIEEYNAKVHLFAGPENAYFTVIIPNMEQNITIYGNTDDIINWDILPTDVDGFIDTDVELSNIKENAVVKCIVIKNN